MAKRAVLNFTDEWFESKGYVRNGNNGWNPPPIKSKYIKDESVKKNDDEEVLTPKLKVNESPNFSIKPVTEWFIKGYSVPSKKNSRQNFITKEGKQLSIPSKKHAEYVKMTAMQYEIFGKEFRRTVDILGLTYPLNIEFTFIRATKHSFDYCNACQTCEDIMKDELKKGVLVKKGWFPDDSAEYLIPSFKPFRIDKEMPGVIIKLLNINNV